MKVPFHQGTCHYANIAASWDPSHEFFKESRLQYFLAINDISALGTVTSKLKEESLPAQQYSLITKPACENQNMQLIGGCSYRYVRPQL